MTIEGIIECYCTSDHLDDVKSAILNHWSVSTWDDEVDILTNGYGTDDEPEDKDVFCDTMASAVWAVTGEFVDILVRFRKSGTGWYYIKQMTEDDYARLIF